MLKILLFLYEAYRLSSSLSKKSRGAKSPLNYKDFAILIISNWNWISPYLKKIPLQKFNYFKNKYK